MTLIAATLSGGFASYIAIRVGQAEMRRDIAALTAGLAKLERTSEKDASEIKQEMRREVDDLRSLVRRLEAKYFKE